MRASATTLQPELTDVELEALLAILRTAGATGPHLEIGTAAGGTLREMMKVYPDDRRPPFVVVDPFTYFPDQRSIVECNLRNAGLDPATVEFRVGYSWPALQDALKRDERFSFIFIDGNHSAKYVMEDLMWTRLLEVGGHVCLHDYKRKFRGVIWATERFLARHGDAYEKVGLTDTLMVLRKRARPAKPEVSSLDILLGTALQRVHRLQWSLDKRFGRAHLPI